MPLFAASTNIDPTELNKVIGAGGSKSNIQVYGARIAYNGSSWEVVSGTENWGITTAMLAWSTDHVVIDVTTLGFQLPPLVFPGPVPSLSVSTPTTFASYVTHAYASDANTIEVYFASAVDGSLIDTEDTAMDVQLYVVGRDA